MSAIVCFRSLSMRPVASTVPESQVYPAQAADQARMPKSFPQIEHAVRQNGTQKQFA
jgi:hypothetical protein